MPPQVRFTSVEFRDYKALGRYHLSLQRMNVMVGPNNSGKSTIVGAFRVLGAGIRRARARSPETCFVGNKSVLGYRLSDDTLPISLENVHTDLGEIDSSVSFRLSNGNHLHLQFPRDGGCVMVAETQGRRVTSPTGFKEAFPVTVGLVPVLGPVEHNEELLTNETVHRDLSTHRASRQFRSYWYHFPEGFENFADLVSKTWPGMEIDPPKRVSPMERRLYMLCYESRIAREIYWAGSGFQIWCQLLAHVTLSREDTILIVDEPEVYLHPDVQRQLVTILRDLTPDIVLATHSSEIMGERDPAEILLIDKAKGSATRLRDVEGVQATLEAIGSVHNVTLAELARSRRLLFVEGPGDFRVFRRFARRLRMAELAAGSSVTPIELGGFSLWDRIEPFAWGMEKVLKGAFRIGAVLDRDYRCREEIADIVKRMEQSLEFVHIHDRKEIENYLLVPSVLNRAISKALAERTNRTNTVPPERVDISEVLERITGPLRPEIQGQYIAKREAYLRSSSDDPATSTAETIRWFDEHWSDLNVRMSIVPGKRVLAALRQHTQSEYHVGLTDAQIIEEFRAEEIPSDLREMLKVLDTFRASPAPS